jgi:enoyl-CoA hydratase/carnithine racemase
VTEQTEQNVLKKKTENHIGFLTLNRPEQANALNRALFLALRNEMEALENDDDVRVIVMTGAGEEAFCAGIDLKERAQLPKHEILLFRERIIKPCFDALRSSPKPLIAAVNGVAFGGGAELALVCDMRVASERARFGQTEIRWGMIPACGACQRLRMIVGIGRAKEIILTGREVGVDEALQWGIYNRVVPAGRLMDEARRLALDIARNSPVAVKQAKKAVDMGAHILESLEFEFEASKACYFAGEAMTGPEKF